MKSSIFYYGNIEFWLLVSSWVYHLVELLTVQSSKKIEIWVGQSNIFHFITIHLYGVLISEQHYKYALQTFCRYILFQNFLFCYIFSTVMTVSWLPDGFQLLQYWIISPRLKPSPPLETTSTARPCCQQYTCKTSRQNSLPKLRYWWYNFNFQCNSRLPKWLPTHTITNISPQSS